MTPLLLITCALPSCQRRFLVCSHCYRGHKYCSTDHAQQARVAVVKKARDEYAKSDAGKDSHRARSKRYYANKKRGKNSLTDPSSTAGSKECRVPPGSAPKASRSPRFQHADDTIIPPDLHPDHAVEPAIPQARCLWCRRPGTRILLRTERFHH